MALLFKRVRTSQPQGAVRVDWNNPLTAGLLSVHLGAHPIDIARSVALTVTGTLGGAVTPGGKSYNFTGSQYLRAPGVIGPSSPVTLLAAGVVTGAADRGLVGVGAASNNRHLLYINSNKAAFFSGNGSGVTGQASMPISSFVAGESCVWVGVNTATNLRSVWQNGVKGTDNTSGVVLGAATDTAIHGAYWTSGAASMQLQGKLNVSAVWGRALSDAEIKSLSDNPWQLFEPLNDSLWIPNAVAGGASLVPDVGSVAISGYAPTLGQTANQALTPSSGSVGITGYAPAVSQSSALGLAPGVGSVAINGYAPTLAQTANLALVPNAGALSVTGYAPTITQDAGQIILPGAGTVAASGYAPTIGQTAHQAVLPGAGSVAVQGYAPTVTQASLNISVSPVQGAATYLGYAPLVQQTGGYVAGAMAGNRPAVSGTRAARLQTSTRAAR